MYTKADAARRFEFLKDTYNKIEGYGFNRDGSEFNMCGVVFFNNWAYITNNHFIGRMTVPDRPPETTVFLNMNDKIDDIVTHDFNPDISAAEKKKKQMSFFDYDADKEEIKDMTGFQYLQEVMHGFFLSIKENSLVFDKDVMLAQLDEIYGRKRVDKIKNVIEITQTESVLKCVIMKRSKKDPYQKTFEIPSESYNSFVTGITSPAKFVVNVLYLYEILSSFYEYKKIKINYDNSPNVPITILGYDYEKGKPELLYGLAQSGTVD